jgi:hypothetical protein
MASGQVLAKFQNFYVKAEGNVKRWNAAQVRTEPAAAIAHRRTRRPLNELQQCLLIPRRNGSCHCWEP